MTTATVKIHYCCKMIHVHVHVCIAISLVAILGIYYNYMFLV
jgi:hypothetical protein